MSCEVSTENVQGNSDRSRDASTLNDTSDLTAPPPAISQLCSNTLLFPWIGPSLNSFLSLGSSTWGSHSIPEAWHISWPFIDHLGREWILLVSVLPWTWAVSMVEQTLYKCLLNSTGKKHSCNHHTKGWATRQRYVT